MEEVSEICVLKIRRSRVRCTKLRVSICMHAPWHVWTIMLNPDENKDHEAAGQLYTTIGEDKDRLTSGHSCFATHSIEVGHDFQNRFDIDMAASGAFSRLF